MSGGRADIGRKERSLWQKIKDVALTDVETLVKGIDQETIDELERVLLESDFGIDATLELVDELERAANRGFVKTEEGLRDHLRKGIHEILGEAGEAAPLRRPPELPSIVLILGVNGTGKTTTAAKLARLHVERGEKVVLAAADTFRAGAQEQVRLWAERVGARFVGGQEGGDPAAVAYDAVESGMEGGADLVLIDTAGRLHTRRNLMEELRKIDRVTGRLVEGAPHERLLVVDATSGQNVVRQARQFGEMLPLTGMVLAKFDSTARGGAVVAVAREHGVPVRFLGTGEEPGDLEIFDPERFTEKILRGE